MPRIVLVEDDLTTRFSPLTLLRPVFELRCGHYSARERARRAFPDGEWGAVVRRELADAYREEHPVCRVNERTWTKASPTLFLNGRWLTSVDELRSLREMKVGTAAWVGNDWVAILLNADVLRGLPDLHPVTMQNLIEHQLPKAERIDVSGHVLKSPWELLEQNSSQLTLDHTSRPRVNAQELSDPRIAVLGDPDQVFVDASARIDPFVVIDAQHGPVWIDADARVQAFTRLEGPCYIGQQTQLFRANVREGCSIGPVCRVGGEIEESILHSHSNKYHDGFLGHSYICPWVNLGANTINSDLKNDYSNVRVLVDGEMIDSGSTKVGCFIGDHTKTALASLFNTGSFVGVMSLILPGGELLPKVIPSFSRIWHGELELLPDGIESSLAVARIAMGRRNLELKPAAEALLRHTYSQTETDRLRCIERWRAKRG